MLEDQVAYLLQRYLGNYVRGLNKEALKISVWQGDVELTNMQLKPEALNALKLPVKVKAGFLGSVKLKVPWSRLGQEPVLVRLERIFLLAEPATHVEGRSEDAIQEAKKSRVREMEMKLLERAQELKSEMNKSWLGSLINTIIGNLKLSISNIHIRYEDLESNPGHPFAAGMTLEKLSAVTVDDNGVESFVLGGSLDRIQKSVELDQLAVYLDSDISPWHVDKSWKDLHPMEWVQVFKFGTSDGKPADHVMDKHSYILQPVCGNALYSKFRPNESFNGDQPLQKAAVNLDDVTICLSKNGYRDVLKLADNFAAFNQRLKYAHFRPHVSVKSDPRSWWRYAYKAVSDQMKKASGRLSWEQVLRYATLQKRYLSLYISLLKSDPSRPIVDDDKEIEELDRELDIELILQWRMLAHKFVKKSFQSDSTLRRQKTKRSWWSFGWNSQPNEDESEQFFSGEDWDQLNKLIGYKEGDDGQSLITNEKADTLQTSLEIKMKHNASKLTDEYQGCLAELSCDDLNCFIKLYPETKIFDVKLGSYRLSSPNGLLAESATTSDSLVGIFCYKPFNVKVDWSMIVKASPCYMTYLKDSISEIVKFFESSSAVSQTIALETAAAVQMTIDEVKRTAQEQVNKALKNQTRYDDVLRLHIGRFLLDLDIAAPKITIPTEFFPDNIHSTKLLLDLGNLIIRSQDDYERGSLEELDLYLQFDLVLSDVSAFLVDGDYDWSQNSKTSFKSSHPDGHSFLPVIDKCGVILRLQQIRLENPSYPSTRLAARLPSLGFHFSPARYHRLMQVAKIFSEEGNENNDNSPWSRADFEGWLSLLTRKGVGNREAVWQRRYLYLVGPFLYVLEGPASKSYKQYLSLRGKQIYQLSAELVGGIEHVLAIYESGYPINKVIEDVNALILRCDSDDSWRTWQSRLQGGIYRASTSAPITSLSETSSDAEDSDTERSDDKTGIYKMESVFITGVLDELKICFDYSQQGNLSFTKVLLCKEAPLFELCAIGGQVEFSMRSNDMFIGTVLNALEIQDLVSCNNVPGPRFLVRSIIGSADVSSSFDDARNESIEVDNLTSNETDDKFYEAPENLDESENWSSQNLFPFENSSFRPPSFSRMSGLLPGDTQTGTQSVELTDAIDSFVKAQIVIYDKYSSLYNNTDMQVSVTLATLSFFCWRPTILAVMEFVNAIGVEDENYESFSDNSSAAIVRHASREGMVEGENFATIEEPIVKGLLGKGKFRIIFNLVLNMARAQILLMNENETTLATLSQDNLLTDIKVFPNSFSIKASLGNLRISDNSLPRTHSYFWICDMRDPGGSSFVELLFTSFSAEDEDYKGYEYSLLGELSEVRIVYLNRFIQEVVNYFLGLAPNNSKGVVKLKDQVTNSEKWFTASEIEGSPALKLDLSLRKPIILMPRETSSPDYLKLDVVHITVQNTFQWFNGSKNEMNAVHLENLVVQVEDINLNVGVGTELGESIIQDVKGVSIVIKRSLRDLLHQTPSVEVTIQIDQLKAALSNREYLIITECATSNISETAHTVPPLNSHSVTYPIDMVEPVVYEDVVHVESGPSDRNSWTSMKFLVAINLVELSLHTGKARDAPLATVQVISPWLLYKSSNLGEGFLSATLKGFTVIDDREGTEEEFRLAIGNSKLSEFDVSFANDDGDQKNSHAGTEKREKLPVPPMLILDGKFGQHSTYVSLCLQRPKLLVALDFLLAVAEFFVPTLGDMLSSEENKNPEEIINAVVLKQPVYKQSSAEMLLSPLRPLIADDERFDHLVYDGNGGILFLRDRQGVSLSSPSKEPIIFVGSGKTLQFRNVIIKNGQYLDSCIQLGSNSSYSASKEDKVQLALEYEAPHEDSPSETNNATPSRDTAAKRSTEFIIELQAIGPELTFYNASKGLGVSQILSKNLLHAQMDAFARLVLRGDTIEMTASTLDFMMESNGIRILEPFDTSMKYSNASGKTDINLSVTDIFMNFTFSILRLFLAVQEDILTFLRITSKKITLTCSEFDKVGIIRNPQSDQIYTFWRPRAPTGFAVLGDYMTPLDKPPTKGVIAVNTNLARVKRPVSFKRVYPPSVSKEISENGTAVSNSAQNNGTNNSCSIWFPEAPDGYVSLGCVVSPGMSPPSLSSAFCISTSLVSPCDLRDCITVSLPNLHPSTIAFWRVDNSAGTFLPADPTTLKLIRQAWELRHIKFGLLEFHPKASADLDGQTSPSVLSDARQSEKSTSINSCRRVEAVASFQLIWSNQASSSRKKLSIWRPVVPQGMVYFGDIAVEGYEPPNTCVVLHDNGDEELLKPPVDYQLVGQIKKQRGMDSISFWMPQSSPGFVPLGCIACKGSPKQYDLSKLRCIRSDMVTGDQFLEESLWDTSETMFRKESFSIWTVGNELRTFVVRSGYKKPPRRFALKFAAPNVTSGSDDTVIDAEIRTFSVAIFDDYGGLMVPLFNISLGGIGFSFRGRAGYLNSTVNCSFAVRSYNDKYEAWEPFLEQVDGFLRYQYDVNAPGPASQLRLTSTRDLNLNVSVSNTNLIIQAYASWNNLSRAHEYYKKEETFSASSRERSMIDVHHKRNYYIVPQNKLGQDIFIRATEIRGLSNVIRMPSGDMKPVKVPVSKNMLDSHLRGKVYTKARAMVTVLIEDAEFPRVKGLTSNVYTLAIRLTPNQNLGGDFLHEQRARTSGSISKFSSSKQDLVSWNELFFFKVDPSENYLLELIVTDIEKGDPIGFYSVPLNQIAATIEEHFYHDDYLKHLRRIDIYMGETTATSHVDGHKKTSGTVRCAVFMSSLSEMEDTNELSATGRKSGFIQISPNMQGPWTTVRLNYAAPAACWRLGNDVVASEVNVNDGNIFVNIRSLVSVRNGTDFTLDLCLVSKVSHESIWLPDDKYENQGLQVLGDRVQADEFFETEIYDPTNGWAGCSSLSESGGANQVMTRIDSPSGWEWVDNWHLDTASINNADGWVYSPDVESLNWPESYPVKSENRARQRRWIRNRKLIAGDMRREISVGLLKPGETLPIPLHGLSQSVSYVLQLRPFGPGTSNDYSWSSVVDKPSNSEGFGESKVSSEICVSSLTESEELVYCNQMTGSSSSDTHKLWFSVSIEALEIGKDIHSDPIQDWNIVIKSPLLISNFLPLAAEYSVLNVKSSGHFVACARGVLSKGSTIKIHTADIRKSLFLSLLPQRGWLPTQEVVLISQPHGMPAKTISLRSSISGRIVQLILEQNYNKEQPLLPKNIRVYAPYWFSIARCPPLIYRLVDMRERKNSRKAALSFQSKNSDEEILGVITEEEIYDGHTIASALNYKMMGFCASICESGQNTQFGPVKDLSPLGDMDGSLDIYAYDGNGNCLRLFISSRLCPYQSVPTKVISVRPFMTFTNRLGQDIFVKLNSEDEPKVLHASDSRISFVCRKISGNDKLQVRLEDTEWSYPVEITKEDTFFMILRCQNGSQRFLKTEIRGFEEGSRFIVVFRLGSTSGPIRTINKKISIRQTGFGEDAWISLEPLSTTNYCLDDPYGQKFLDAKIDSEGRINIWKLDLEATSIPENSEVGLQVHISEVGNIKVIQVTDIIHSNAHGLQSRPHSVNWGNSHLQTEVQDATPMEVIVELGVVGISIVDHRPKDISYLYLERVFLSYSNGYDGGTTSRFKLILGYLQLDNQLPLTLMPVLLAPEQVADMHNPVFKMTITMRNENTDGIQVYPIVYIRVTDKVWRLNIHEPIIWSLIDVYNKLQLDRIPQSSSVTQVDPEIRVGLIDISEIRLKVSLETAPAQRPHGVLGVWSPILSAIGNAFKIQVHLRRVMHKDRFMRKSSIVPAIGNRIRRDLIHNPLHLIFSVDVLGMTSSTLSSLSKGFAELSTDGQFLQLRSKQVGSRRITGVGDGIMQGTEALAQGVAFGVSGVVRKPVESARQNGILGLAHGLGRAFLGFIVQPVSGALDFFSLTVDGIGASCSKCLEVLSNRTTSQRIRNPRAIHSDCILREYCEKEAIGQMVLYHAEASRQFGCTEIFKEPSKFASTDYFEEYFIVPHNRVVLVTNKRVMLLQCPNLEKMDRKPSKIMWDVPWDELMALELAKAGYNQPTHLLLHLKSFHRSENFVRVIKCNLREESEESEPQAVRICSVVRRIWKSYQSDMKSLVLKVPSSQRHVYFAWTEADGQEAYPSSKSIIKSRESSSLSSVSDDERFVKHSINFSKIWSSERESKGRCKLCRKQVSEDSEIFSIWRPSCPDGYISIGDIAHVGSHPPNVSAIYRRIDRMFVLPLGYDLVWRNCPDDYKNPVSIWHPRAPEGFASPGCVAVDGFREPEANLVYCVAESLVEQTEFEEQKVWSSPDSYPWACHIYQVKSDALHFVALRQRKEDSDWKPMRMVDDLQPRLQSLPESK